MLDFIKTAFKGLFPALLWINVILSAIIGGIIGNSLGRSYGFTGGGHRSSGSYWA
ncbi:MAG: hypothetical protein LBB81_10895 [Treponema sp.]|jgi:hypothetical protein|nr:hypothetical protein [Treponema sp.]